jgi:hypothetical protein
MRLIRGISHNGKDYVEYAEHEKIVYELEQEIEELEQELEVKDNLLQIKNGLCCGSPDDCKLRGKIENALELSRYAANECNKLIRKVENLSANMDLIYGAMKL